MGVLIILIFVIILQCICITTHHILHLKYTLYIIYTMYKHIIYKYIFQLLIKLKKY